MNHSTIIPPRFLVTKEAARFLVLSAPTLEKHRSYGTGPVYRKIGGRVVYAIADLLAWADKGLRYSTLEPGLDVIYPTSWGAVLKKPVKQLTDRSEKARSNGSRVWVSLDPRAFIAATTSFDQPRS